jgi:dTMP kinase
VADKRLARVRGKFIVFDGLDGSGKGSQIKMLHDALTGAGVPAVCTRDPGGTPIGDRIRHVLLDYDLSQMDVRCEALLFMASRAQLLKEVIEPALAAGKACLCDRFVSATCAYQGAAGFDPKRVIELARFAIGDCWPALTIILDVPPQVGLERTGRAKKSRKQGQDVTGQVRLFHDTHPDAMEARPLAFHEQVRAMSLELPKYYPAPVEIVDALAEPEKVHARVLEAIDRAIR